MNEIEASLAAAINKATAAADRLLKCAESISNPVYSITMDGQALEILAVHHFQGQINIQVKSPFAAMDAAVKRRMLGLTPEELRLGAIDVL
jgi:hypothetical protein